MVIMKRLKTFQAAVAQAALAFQLYQRKFSGPRWEALAKKGAKKQRLLWASTSVKNPAYPDTLYVAPLIGPDTVSHPSFHYYLFSILGVVLEIIMSPLPWKTIPCFVFCFLRTQKARK